MEGNDQLLPLDVHLAQTYLVPDNQDDPAEPQSHELGCPALEARLPAAGHGRRTAGGRSRVAIVVTVLVFADEDTGLLAISRRRGRDSLWRPKPR